MFEHCLFFVGKVSAVLIHLATVGVAHPPFVWSEFVPGKMSDIIFASFSPRVAVPFDAAVGFDNDPDVFFTESYECALQLTRVGLFEISCKRDLVKRIDRLVHNRVSQSGNGCFAVDVTFFYVVVPTENVLICKVVDAFQRDFLSKVVVNRDLCLVAVVRQGVCAFGNLTLQFASDKVKFVIEKCVFQFNFTVGQSDRPALRVTGFKSTDCILDGNRLVLGCHNVDCNVCKIFVKYPFLEGHCGFHFLSVNLEGSDRISFFYGNCNFRKVVYFESFFLACNGDVFTVDNVLERGVAFAFSKVSGDIRFDEVGQSCIGYCTEVCQTDRDLACADFFTDVAHADIFAVEERIYVCTLAHQCKRKSAVCKHCLFFFGKTHCLACRITQTPFVWSEFVPRSPGNVDDFAIHPGVAVPLERTVFFDIEPNKLIAKLDKYAHGFVFCLRAVGIQRDCDVIKQFRRLVSQGVLSVFQCKPCFTVRVDFFRLVAPEHIARFKVDMIERDRFVKVVVNRDRRRIVAVIGQSVVTFCNVTGQFTSDKVKFVLENCVFQFNFAIGQIDRPALRVTGFKSTDCVFDVNGLVLGCHNVNCNVCKIFVKYPFLEGHCRFCILSVNLEGCDRVAFFQTQRNFDKVI